MTRVYVVVEGQTEESFVGNVLASEDFLGETDLSDSNSVRQTRP